MMLSTSRSADLTQRRSYQRVLVIAILIGTGLLASALPPSLGGLGLIAVLVLTTLDLVLIRSTRGLAFARGKSLDERERAIRDHAYRVGFRWLGLAVVVMLVVVVFTAVAAIQLFPATAASFPGDLNIGISGRVLFAVLELLCIAPTLVIAWTQPDGSDEPPHRASQRRAALTLMWLVLPGMLALWVLDVTLVPVQAATRNPNFGSPYPAPDCQDFAGGRVVGGPFGATVGIDVTVCWTGTRASIGENHFVNDCGSNTNDDFANVAETCTTRTDSDGTLHYVVRARVSPLPFSIGARDVTLTLVVAGSGAVLEQP